jgi:predicted regulator of Ras-like GTPase activity (Roadblock/LC7/MglB family)
MSGAGKKAILVVVIQPSVPMKIVTQEMKRAAEQIEQKL